MKKKNEKKDKAKNIRTGVRLNTPAPKIIQPNNVYKRRKKHQEDTEEE